MSDRPWGQTLGALGVRELTGQLTLFADDGKQYRIAFERGAVVGATSPLSSDSAARVALTNHLVTSTQVPQIAKLLAANPDRDELDVIVEVCNLDLDRALALRERVIAQRAARTFIVEGGGFVVHDQVTIPTSKTAAIDIRGVVYLGVRLNLAEARLFEDLRSLGSHFQLKPDSEDALAHFGFTSAEQPILAALRQGATLPELEARYRDIDPRSMQAVIYSLVSCLACEAVHTEAVPPPYQPIVAKPVHEAAEDGIRIKRPTRMPPDPPAAWTAVGTPTRPTMPRTPTPDAPTLPRTDTLRSSRPYEDPTPRVDPRHRPPSDPQPRASDRPITFTARTATTTTVPPVSRTATPLSIQPRTATTSRLPVSRTTSPNRPLEVRTPSPQPFAALTAEHTPPEPLQARAPTPIPRTSQTLPPLQRTPTGEPAPFGPEEPSAGRVIDPLGMAAEAYKRGQALLRDDQVQQAIEELQKATELNPSEFDYAATLAWAQFCGSDDRPRIADKVRKMLTHAIMKSNHPELARFYLGRMERMLGRHKEALFHFRQVLDAEPKNADAAAEIRQLEARIASERNTGGGLFGRKKDK